MRSSVVRPIAVYTLAWCGGFSRRLCPFHGPATPDFEAALVCYIGPLPTWHVERSRKSPKWLVAFVAAISCLVRIDDMFHSDPRGQKPWNRALNLNDKVERLATRDLLIHLFTHTASRLQLWLRTLMKHG